MLLNVWLDDEPEKRKCPEGFIHVDNIDDIKQMLLAGEIDQLSLDHDLGVCGRCAIAATSTGKDPGASCEHVPTGYDLVVWMEATGEWPLQKPIVHSRNPVGRERMERVIETSYGTDPPATGGHVWISCVCGTWLRKTFAEVSPIGHDRLRSLALSMGWKDVYRDRVGGKRRSWDSCFSCVRSTTDDGIRVAAADDLLDPGYRMLLRCECRADLTSGPAPKPDGGYQERLAAFAKSNGWSVIHPTRRLNAKCFACISKSRNDG